MGKCGYAASLYTVLFYSKLLGVSVDRPAQRLQWRPLLPWDKLEWRNCRIGQFKFHASYHRQPHSLTAEITNLNPDPFSAEIELPMPVETHLETGEVDGKVFNLRCGTLYGHSSAVVNETLKPGTILRVRLRF